MNISPVSFGKIVKVNAPQHIAEKIAIMANGDGKSKIDKDVKKIFDDIDEGRACVYSPDNENETYIFSGKEGDAFKMSYKSAELVSDYAADYYGDDDFTSAAINEAWSRHRDNVWELLGLCSEKSALKVDYDNETGKIKSVDLIV